ncbi:hypothetical protein LIER_16832 [Lithospermum erythrorhizon]|uniref:Uncharacterized protein n=1 Tax=Lithospermum erythrorhizon TaxID=34254 RepID=A0AAV3QCI7_LITER
MKRRKCWYNIYKESEIWPDFSDPVTENVPLQRNQEADRLSQLATVEYETIPDSTPIEWVVEEAFRTKEVMDYAPEGEGTALGPRYQDILEFLKTGVLPRDPPGG